MSSLRKGIFIINKVYTNILVLGCRFLFRRHYDSIYKKVTRKYGKFEVSKKEVVKWQKKWSQLCQKPHLNTFRLFSQYIGENSDIVPEDVSAGIIQPLLNPIEFRQFYQDKNFFEKIIPKDFLPKAVLRSINGAFYSSNYEFIDLTNEILNNITASIPCLFLKPSVETSSGKGVTCFKRNPLGILENVENHIPLSIDYLYNYQKNCNNFIIQEGLSQSDYINQFNPSSINTLRVVSYKSVVDAKTYILQIIMRIGKTGSIVDNAHAGGVFIGVNHDGSLAKYACDQYGNKFETFNGIDFKNNHYKIPSFDKVLEFAQTIGDCIMHHRLVAQDICITKDGKPCLVEFNIGAFSSWLFQFAIGPAFGEKTDEIIDYCSKNRNKVNKINVVPF